MSALVVDTSAWITFLRTGQPSVELALQESRAFITPVVAAELMSGLVNKRQERDLEQLITELPLTEAPLSHWMAVGRLRRRLATAGFTVSTPDAHVCQSALDLDAYLLTEDAIFKKVARLIHLRLA